MASAQKVGTTEEAGPNSQSGAAAEVAAEAPPPPAGPVVTGYVGFVTDYRWRGVSLSDENVAVQGGFSAASNGFYAGVWGSNIGFLPDSEVEVDLYAGYGFVVSGDTKLDLQTKYISFPGQSDAAFFRVSANLTGKIGPVGWGLHGDYEPAQSETLLNGSDNHYLYATAGVPLGTSGFSINGKVGREDGAFADRKVDWLLGLTKSVAGFDISAQYVGTNRSGRGLDDTVVVGVRRSF